ncbi:HNH endonuclease signature motif containing protein [Klebsiella oxytoca]|uniref:HNH endonuclease signature motif containing protein n=1 Tax=Klebsiella oxytoca TaxID=571 RepID=UPI0032DB6FF6
MRDKYSPAQELFIRHHIKSSTARELTEMFNAHFGTNKSVGAIRIWCKSHGLGNEFLLEPRYTDEQLTFIYANKQLTNVELTERFNKRFSTNKKPDNIKDVKIARGWTRQTTGRKRALPQYITVNKEKILLDVYVYECVHGKLPDGYSVIHLDNDLKNNNIDNLRAAPKEIHRLFSGAGYSKMPQVLAPALYAQMILRHAIKRLSM